MAAKGAGTGNLPKELKGDASLVEALLEGSPIGIFLVDREYAIQYVNPVLAEWIRKPANCLRSAIRSMSRRRPIRTTSVIRSSAPSGPIPTSIRWCMRFTTFV